MSTRSILLIVMLAGLAVVGCRRPHYAVAVAASQNHVTFATRHAEADENDYLVDCKLDANGRYSECYTIELVTDE